MGLKLKVRGDYNETVEFLGRLEHFDFSRKKQILSKYGELGVKYLAAATPKRTGTTAAAWSYELESSGNVDKIVFYNSNVNKGVNIALILQYGHGTRGGGYVQGLDYINPASQEVFQQMADELWSEVTR